MAGKLSIELLLSAVAVKNQFEGVAETFEDEEAKKETLKQIETLTNSFGFSSLIPRPKRYTKMSKRAGWNLAKREGLW